MIFADEGETVYQTETVYDDTTGLPVRQLTWLNGVLQSPPDDSPAQVLFDKQGRVREMIWWNNGEKHRDPEKGPACIKIAPDTGVHVVERYKVNGNTSRSRSEPALIVRDPVTGEITKTEHYLHGVHVSKRSRGVDLKP